MKTYPILDRIESPHQLRRLTGGELQRLAEEMRQRIIEVVSRQGGHLASNLGVAELTIALHYVFDFSRDRLLWDVGHQCYPHKLLTGRAKDFDTLRLSRGLSGFPAPSESPYDLFAGGHAGTAISTSTSPTSPAPRSSRSSGMPGSSTVCRSKGSTTSPFWRGSS